MIRTSIRILVWFAIFLLGNRAFAQSDSWTAGFEQDVLPYVTGGYFVNAWAGKGHVRARVLLAHVHKPAFIVPKGFTNNTVTAYACVADYFLRTRWEGPWIGAGLVRWKSAIQDKGATATAHYSNWLLNGSIGYSWRVYKHFYAGPWAGLHVRVGGAREVTAGAASFQVPLFTPEASLKIGWYF